MESRATGTCKHGPFPLLEGCPQCIEESRSTSATDPVAMQPALGDSPEAHGIDPDYEAARADQSIATGEEPADIEADDWQKIQPLGRLIPEAFKEPPGFALIRTEPDGDDRVTALYLEGCSALAHAQARMIASNEDLKPATAVMNS